MQLKAFNRSMGTTLQCILIPPFQWQPLLHLVVAWEVEHHISSRTPHTWQSSLMSHLLLLLHGCNFREERGHASHIVIITFSISHGLSHERRTTVVDVMEKVLTSNVPITDSPQSCINAFPINELPLYKTVPIDITLRRGLGGFAP